MFDKKSLPDKKLRGATEFNALSAINAKLALETTPYYVVFTKLEAFMTATLQTLIKFERIGIVILTASDPFCNLVGDVTWLKYFPILHLPDHTAARRTESNTFNDRRLDGLGLTLNQEVVLYYILKSKNTETLLVSHVFDYMRDNSRGIPNASYIAKDRPIRIFESLEKHGLIRLSKSSISNDDNKLLDTIHIARCLLCSPPLETNLGAKLKNSKISKLSRFEQAQKDNVSASDIYETARRGLGYNFRISELVFLRDVIKSKGRQTVISIRKVFSYLKKLHSTDTPLHRIYNSPDNCDIVVMIQRLCSKFHFISYDSFSREISFLPNCNVLLEKIETEINNLDSKHSRTNGSNKEGVSAEPLVLLVSAYLTDECET